MARRTGRPHPSTVDAMVEAYAGIDPATGKLRTVDAVAAMFGVGRADAPR